MGVLHANMLSKKQDSGLVTNGKVYRKREQSELMSGLVTLILTVQPANCGWRP